MDILALLDPVRTRLRPPVLVALGPPRAVADLAALVPAPVTCLQMDLFQAERVRQEMLETGADAQVLALPDIWDAPGRFGSVVFPMQTMGEREMKLDVLEQAYHVLEPGGLVAVLSGTVPEILAPKWLKKLYGKPSYVPHERTGTTLWATRGEDRPRRRHELSYHARVGDAPAMNFLSRPGTFSYGELDQGARALLETADIRPGDHVLDLGCGNGANGVLAAHRFGAEGSVTFVDSNVRALALAEHNARSNGVTNFRVVASPTVEGVPPRTVDVVLANPPYHAQTSIAKLFIDASRPLLKPGGRFHLVTRQPHKVGPLIAETFGEEFGAELRRGYTVFTALA